MASATLLLPQLLTIVVAARLGGAAATRLGQTRSVGEIVAGLALGPSLLGALAPGVQQALFPPGQLAPLETLGQIGVLLFLFTVGARLELGALRDNARTAVAVSHASIALPLALGVAIAPALPAAFAGTAGGPLPFALFVGTALSVTAFPVLATIVEERGLAGTRLGALALAAAAVDDVTAWCLLAAVVAAARAGGAWMALGGTLAATVAVVLVALGSRPALARGAERLVARRGAEAARVALPASLVLLFALSWATDRAGVHALFGAFLAGTLVPRTGGLAEATAARLGDLGTVVLLPVFFALTGLRIRLDLASSAAAWTAFALLLVAAVVGKLAGSALAARWTGERWRDALALGALMNTRGLMALVVLAVGLEAGVIAEPLYGLMVLLALATTAMASPILARLGVGTAARAPRPAGAPEPA